MNICKENIAEAERALTQKPPFAASAERILILDRIKSEYKELPQPLRLAEFLSVLLGEVSVPLKPHDLIAGRCADRELTEEEEKIFKDLIRHPDYPYRSVFLGSGHTTCSWEDMASLGLSGLRERAETRLEACEDGDKRVFLTAVIRIYDTIASYILRYARAAEAAGMDELAANLRKAADRPDSFASALQLLWMITLIECAYVTKNPTLTVGRLDRILYPFYVSDIRKGTLTRERAAEYITDYYCKHNLIMGRGEHQMGDDTNSTTFDRICNFDSPQYLLLAGTDENGEPAANELTELFAERIIPSFKNPVVVVRYVKDMDKTHPSLWRTLTDKALSSSSLMFYNDANVISTLLRIGLPVEDARGYAHFGCNWCSPGDNSAWIQGTPKSIHFGAFESEEERRKLDTRYMRMNTEHGWPEDFMEVMRELAATEREDVTIEDFYRLFLERVGDFIDRKLAHVSHEVTVRQRRPSAVLTYEDCFHTESVRNAESIGAVARYKFDLISFQMFATVADCFIAVDQLVMREKRLTLGRLLAAVEAGFEGYEDVLALCRGADKYGMDTPLSNAHVKRLAHTFSDLVMQKNRPYFERQRLFLVPCMQSDTWHLKKGADFGATPDGRLAHTAFSQNSRPSNGVCVNGLTAMLNSMLNLPTDGLVSGALNLDIDSKQFEGEAGKAVFSALLAVYFNRGGLHAQVTCADVRDLTDAQINPHLHRDLRVRVTGYSGVFVDICKKLQDDIIERMK
ncbi:MAG: hypothetical protein IJY08_00215 [Clostridia bacterium]|nr:hypothetical protein [Clostridia bacterium]